LSEAKHPLPLTIGTNLALFLHDYRSRRSGVSSGSEVERLDSPGVLSSTRRSNTFEGLLGAGPGPVGHLYQPGPLSILHLPRSGEELSGDSDIYVAGRFPSM
jgi:hypothetical protein